MCNQDKFLFSAEVTCFAVNAMPVEVLEDNDLNEGGCKGGGEDEHEAHPHDMDIVEVLVHLVQPSV